MLKNFTWAEANGHLLYHNTKTMKISDLLTLERQENNDIVVVYYRKGTSFPFVTYRENGTCMVNMPIGSMGTALAVLRTILPKSIYCAQMGTKYFAINDSKGTKTLLRGKVEVDL